MKREVKEEAGLDFEPEALVQIESYEKMSWFRFTFSGVLNLRVHLCCTNFCTFYYCIQEYFRGATVCSLLEKMGFLWLSIVYVNNVNTLKVFMLIRSVTVIASALFYAWGVFVYNIYINC